jgi:hypothetical protein
MEFDSDPFVRHSNASFVLLQTEESCGNLQIEHDESFEVVHVGRAMGDYE